MIKVGSEYVWLDWVAIEPWNKGIPGFNISKERNMCVAMEKFISGLIKTYDKHPLSIDGGTWYPQSCKFLKLDHHLHSHYEKSIIERTMQYIKDRTAESFDDYFPCKRKKCKLKHVKYWLKLFVVDYHNKEISLE